MSDAIAPLPNGVELALLPSTGRAPNAMRASMATTNPAIARNSPLLMKRAGRTLPPILSRGPAR